MGRADQTQFNVRSAFAKARARELAELTGMTVTQIVEDALRGYVPPGIPANVPEGMIRKGPLLILPSRGRKITLAETNAEIEASRNRELFYDD